MTDNNTILNRLVLKGRVVGYEYRFKHPYGNKPMEILHCKEETKWHSINSLEQNNVLYDGCYIPHDRIDRWTGVTLGDGTKVFDRDIVAGQGRSRYIITYKEGAFMLGDINNPQDAIAYLQVYQHIITKVTGIQGGKEGTGDE